MVEDRLSMGNSQELALVPVSRGLDPLTTAVLYWKDARRYLKISSAGFCELVKAKVLRRYTHPGGKRPFFLKHELDAYLRRLPEYNDGVSEPGSEKESGK